MQKIVVIKIGTSSITKNCEEGIDLNIVQDLAQASAKIVATGYKVIIVSSGAMSLGQARLGTKHLETQLGVNPCKSKLTVYKQALTSIGQVELMKHYQEYFAQLNLEVGQVLVTHSGIKDEHRNSNLKETLEKMFELNIVPIVNANDTVSPKEIVVGDNDSLAARISILISAEKLFLLTDVDGVYDKDPFKNDDAKHFSEIEVIDDKLLKLAGESESKVGTGGMKSKLNSAKICQAKNIHVEILDARHCFDLEKFVLEKDHSIKSTTILPS